jgi:hydroxyquinol 1,2-dioxygenase
MRPAHIHFMIRKQGFDTLVTHVFADGAPYLESDAVFGVRSSCAGRFVSHERGLVPGGSSLDTPFRTLEWTFVLTPPA